MIFRIPDPVLGNFRRLSKYLGMSEKAVHFFHEKSLQAFIFTLIPSVKLIRNKRSPGLA